MMVSAIISRVVILVFGTLYPAYASYKAVKTKNVREYVKWMMYWIVFALFTCAETFADIFLSWVPFYYEAKIVFVLWLLSPATKGSSILYRKFVHPQLTKREQKIDAYIQQASDKGYSAILTVGSKGLSYASNVVVQTALKGHGAVLDHLKKSYSMSDLSVEGSSTAVGPNVPPVIPDNEDELDNLDNRLIEEREEANRRLREGRKENEMLQQKGNAGGQDDVITTRDTQLRSRTSKYSHKEAPTELSAARFQLRRITRKSKSFTEGSTK
ncbi:receptor expression-enhancing protein 1 isoform X3 [Lingula anatina]|uniref:Receptor expression-enhancing protein n=1 Tax=Lingula anatina TaxID=7574 RepID=A0A1S3J006_LINAN|nr:receptor expression-enhancing protein 1 isoform X3 [Lingula anatina]|eukprot:XP_013403581.1 receptor expression-enhancing protein 1 isoform X3 [Lingula anatina]